MKVNYTLWQFGLSGGVRVILKFAEGLARKGNQVTISSLLSNVCYHPVENVRLINAKIPPFGRYWSHAFLKLGFPLVSSGFLRNAIPTCDINVATLCLTAFVVEASGQGVPFYHMQHYETLTMTSRGAKEIAERSYDLPLRKIVNSLWLQNIIHEKFGETPPIIHPGIDIEIFRPYNVVKNSHKKRVVCFGTPMTWKGISDLFEALKTVKKTIPEIELIMYGSCPRLRLQSPVHAGYVYKPDDTHLAKLYSSADVVVCPSWYESFPLPPLEAMACGAPVITTKFGTEDYAFNEENSLVVLPRKPKLLGQALLRILSEEDLGETFRKKGLETATRFTWDKAVSKVEALFRKTLRA